MRTVSQVTIAQLLFAYKIIQKGEKMSSTFEQLKDILVKRFDAEETRVTPDAAIADIGLDSLTLMEFIFAAEDHFALRLPEEKLDPRQAGLTLTEVATAIDEELARKKAGA